MTGALGWDAALLARVEDASLNASAPPQQRWIDGWLVRFAPGKARRARCIHAVAAGRLPLPERLALAAAVYEEAGLPLHLRITPFSLPADLDATLAGMGWAAVDPTRVMLRRLAAAGSPPPAAAPPGGLRLHTPGLADFALAVGTLRGSSAAEIEGHAERLGQLPVPCRAAVLRDGSEVAACALVAREAELVGLYDVVTALAWRGRHLAPWLCERLLLEEASCGAKVAYLQVSEENDVARAVYSRMGFDDGYGYHYRVPPPGATHREGLPAAPSGPATVRGSPSPPP